MSRWLCLFAAVHVHAQCVDVQQVQPGDGMTFPQPGDSVSIAYTGTLTNGQKFDSSRDRGKDFTTQIGENQVIQGWDVGILQMTLGERAILHISAACAYGPQGNPPAIPPNADLIFDVQLDAINGRQAPAKPSGAAAPAPIATAPAPIATAPSQLPTCKPHSCGMGMASPSNPNVAVCSCDMSCLNHGSLPCCLSFLQVCQAPPTPTLALAVPLPPSPHGKARVAPQQSPFQAPIQAAPLAPAAPQAPATLNGRQLPACTPADCGIAISWDGSPDGTPACLCSPLCVYWAGESGILPCCNKLQEVCLDPFRSPSPITPAPTPTLFATPSASLFATLPAASMREADGSLEVQSGETQFSQPGQQILMAARLPSTVSPACSMGMSAWAEQSGCSKKRYAIKSGQCQKVCSSVDPQAGIKYYPKTTAGKAACEAALKLC